MKELLAQTLFVLSTTLRSTWLLPLVRSHHLYTLCFVVSMMVGSIGLFVLLPAFRVQENTSTERSTAVLGSTVTKEVLAAIDAPAMLSKLTVNVPASFTDGVTLSKGLVVLGPTTFQDTVTLENKDLSLGSGKLTAGNVVYSLTGGTGVTITAGQTPTITNSGVLSLGGSTGALTLTGGTGISVSGLTITNAAKAFKTIKVGSDSITAGSIDDSLTFTSGTGISLSKSNNTITIAGAASDLNVSGWADDGTSVRLGTISDSIGIGVLVPAAKMHVLGTTEQLRVAYDATNYTSFSAGSTGNFTVAPSGGGTSITGTLGVSGLLTASGGVSVPSGQTLSVAGTIASTLTPSATNTYSLGSASNQWANVYGQNMYVSGNLIATGATAGHWQRNSGAVSLSNITDDLIVGAAATGSALFQVSGTTGALTAATVIAPVTNGTTTSLTVRAANGSTGNIFNITNTAGNTSYLSIDNTGSLTINGSTLTNAGLLESSGAIHLTTSANALVGTAIEGGWTMNSNTFTYRRGITVTNNDGANALPTNYEVSVTIPAAAASQIYANSQADADDFRIAYNNAGTITEIARNVSSYTSSSMVFTFQLQAAIDASGTSSNYYIYYKNTALACSSCTYTGSVQLDSLDSQASNWTSADTTQFPLSDEASVYTEGSGSLKASATVDNIGTFSSSSQNALASARTNFGFTSSAISGTTYLYAVGGSSDGTDANAQTSVYRTSVAAATGNVAAWSTNANSLSAAVVDNSVAVVTPPVDGGTGADGAIDLTSGGGAGGCTGTGLSWDAGSSTCTIATATKSTFNFTTVTIPVGTTLTTDGPKTTTNFVTIKATGAVSVAGTINLAGKGYSGGTSAQNGYGPGGGGYDTQWQTFSPTYDFGAGGGGGYGGAGGRGGSAYNRGYGVGGSTYETDDSGSGGGPGENSSNWAAGGAGGGGIKISSSETITVAGTINANGATGSVNLGISGGGGSGGRAWLQGASITVSGSITANGGNGGADSNNIGGGGGGGGRITLEYSNSVDTTGSTVTVTAGSRGGTGYNAANGSAGSSGNTQSSPVLFVLGGKNTSGTTQTGISQATITASDGSVGSFSASSVSLPQALYGQTSNVVTVGTTNYMYIVGGHNGTSDQVTVYKGTFSGSNISAISTTSQTQLGTGISYHATVTGSISSTNYIWVLGGINGATAQTAVYRGTIDASGNITALSTSSQGTLPQGLYGHKALFVTVGSNNYIYVYGGKNSAGTRQTTVYKATVDASGNVGTFTTVGQTQLSTAISDFGAFTFTDSDSNQYAYIVGGNTGTVQTAVMKTKYTPIDQTTYSFARTISASNWTNKNDLQFKVYSSRTGSYARLEFSEDGSTWTNCSAFTVSGANGWETKTCDISGVASASKNAVTRLRFSVTSSATTAWTAYIDDIKALTNATSISNTGSHGSAILGAADLRVNGQGTGAVLLNYDGSAGQAGSGGMKLYDGAAGLLMDFTTTGDASAAGSLVLTGASASATLDVLNGQHLAFQTSAGGDTGLGTRMLLSNSGNLGIGTTTPAFRLDVVENQAATVAAMIANANTGASGSVLALKSGAAAVGTGNYFLSFLNGSGAIIGKVQGNGSGGVSYATSGIDFAEYYKKADPAESFSAGDLVCLVPAGGVSKCQRGSGGSILGIISGHAGFVGGADREDDPSYVLVGLIGQLPVKVATESGYIHPSDPLTMSDTAGVARKATTKGQIFGRALQSFDPIAATNSGNLVMVTLGVQSFEPDDMAIAAIPGEMLPQTLPLGSESATLTGALSVTGRTVLSELGVTGTISNGLLRINGLESEIYTLAGDIKLQENGLGGVRMVGGKVVIDRQGILHATQVTATAVEIETVTIRSGKSMGTALLPSGKRELEIEAAAATETARIFLTPTSLTARQLVVTKKGKGKFTVAIKDVDSEPITFDWWVIGSTE